MTARAVARPAAGRLGRPTARRREDPWARVVEGYFRAHAVLVYCHGSPRRSRRSSQPIVPPRNGLATLVGPGRSFAVMRGKVR